MSRSAVLRLSTSLTVALIACSAQAQQVRGPGRAGQGEGEALLQLTPRAEEATKQYDCGNPTPQEQRVLELINRARANPSAEGDRLGIDLSEGLPDEEATQLAPKPPLAMNPILLATARAHSEDMYKNNHNEHKDSQGLLPAERMDKAGYVGHAWAENIAWSTGRGGSLEELQDMLLVDKLDKKRGHRANLLDLHPNLSFREVGIGAYEASTPNKLGDRLFLTEDFGAGDAGPFLVGVAYVDKNENHFYDVGEGLAGVRIQTERGAYHAVTSASGGYALPVPANSGTLQVTASGGGLGAPGTRNVRVADVNVKLDFVLEAGRAGP